MAIAQKPAAEVTFVLQDETGSTASVGFNVPAATTIADAVTAATAMVAHLDGISTATVLGWSISYNASEQGAGAAPGSESRVERKGAFVMGTAAAKKVTYQVPSIDYALLVDGGRIDEDNAAVAAFLTALAGAPWSDSNGVDIVGLRAAYERSRSSTRRQLPSKRNPDQP